MAPEDLRDSRGGGLLMGAQQAWFDAGDPVPPHIAVARNPDLQDLLRFNVAAYAETEDGETTLYPNAQREQGLLLTGTAYFRTAGHIPIAFDVRARLSTFQKLFA